MKYWNLIIWIFSAVFVLSSTASGQTMHADYKDVAETVQKQGQSSVTPNGYPPEDTAGTMNHERQKSIPTKPMTMFEFKLSTGLLVFAILIILIESWLVRAQKISGTESVKFIIITLIIVSTLYLITAGYSNDQIAPAVGLLGTIAGYLLGKNAVGDNPPPSPPPNSPAPSNPSGAGNPVNPSGT